MIHLLHHEVQSHVTPLESIKEFYGAETRTSDWYLVEQSTIDKFGEATGDMDWIHTDPERARRESPFGGTIAFGFWTISMLTYFGRQIMQRDYPGDALYGLNYGFDRLRLMAPVPVGKRIRCHIRLMSVEERGTGRYLVKSEYKIEVEGHSAKPAMVAEWLFLLVFPE
ncbi:MAG: MaoC family dehydratase [Planctomycetaceae bacterium]|nr:MaoC family dehydratase [Planctomycetaceae bacterium]